MQGGPPYRNSEPLSVVQIADESTALGPVTDYLDTVPVDIELTVRTDPERVLDDISPTVDCVITEFQLAASDGLTVVEELAATHPQLPVVLLTDGYDPEVVRETFDAGAAAHLRTETVERTPEKLANRLLSESGPRRTGTNSVRDAVSDLVSRIDHRLVHTDSREAIETAVCEEVSRSEPFSFAWIGTTLHGSDEIQPRVSDGASDNYLADVTIRADETELGDGPAGSAIKTGEIAISNDVRADDRFDPWTEQAVERGFEAVAAIPLRYGEADYGILVIYADETGAFCPETETLLEQLQSNLSRALHRQVLRTEMAEYRQMVEEAANAIFLTDEDGEITYANESFEQLLHRESAALTGQKLWETDVSAAGHTADSPLSDSVRSGSSWEGEVSFQSQGGSDRTVNLTVAPIHTAETDRFVGVGTDVTEERSLRDRLEQQRNELRLLNRILRHDIRNDVQVLMGTAEHMAHREASDIEHHVDRIVEKSERIDEQTRTAADISATITSEDNDLEKRVDVESVISDEVRDLQRSFDAEVTHEELSSNPSVRADDMLHSLFGNLLQNAVQHNDETDVEVTISTEVDEDVVTIRVADNGRGIPDEEKSRLFGRGEQGDESSGSGVGLFLVDVLVEKYGGDIHIEDNEPKGAVFVVELNRSEQPPAASE